LIGRQFPKEFNYKKNFDCVNNYDDGNKKIYELYNSIDVIFWERVNLGIFITVIESKSFNTIRIVYIIRRDPY